MANASNYLENKIVDHLFRSGTLAKLATVYVALFTIGPTDAGGGTEVSGGGYARVAVSVSDSAWVATQGGTSGSSTGTTGQTSNAAAVTFPVPSANWGRATHFGLFDAPTGGNYLAGNVLTASRDIFANDPAPVFQAGALVVVVA